MASELTSSAFSSQGTISDRYTCEGGDISPPLAWSDAPEETRECALICEDPDAPDGTFAHWLFYNIPPGRAELPEGGPTDRTLPWGGA